MTRVKVCGLCSARDAAAAVGAGADLIGVVLWAPSPRAVGVEGARRVREAVPGHVELVGVFVDEEPEEVARLADAIGLDRLQLYGGPDGADEGRLAGRVLRGVRDGDVSGVPPGVPVVFDRAWGEATPDRPALEAHWAAARAAGASRPILLAGHLDPTVVGDAVRAARPFGVDVARGVEREPGVKDHDAVRRFVAAAKEAA